MTARFPQVFQTQSQGEYMRFEGDFLILEKKIAKN